MSSGYSAGLSSPAPASCSTTPSARSSSTGSACTRCTRHPAGLQHGAHHRAGPGGRALAIGSPGADRITTALMLVLGQGCLHDRDLHTATTPRASTCAGSTTASCVEHERDEAIAAAVGARAAEPRVRRAAHVLRRRRRRRVSVRGLVAAGDARREAATG